MSQTETRNHKIKCQYGIADYLKFYKNTVDNPVDDKLYRKILRDYLVMNRDLVSEKAYTFRLPQRLGRIEVRKTKKEVKIDKNGNVVNKLAINWKKTNQLWKENKEAKKKKIKIRYTNEHTNGYIFRPRYIKNTANFKNKSVYKLSVNREMRRNMEGAIMNKTIDAFLLYPNQ